MTFFPLADVVHQAAGIAESDPPSAARAKLDAVLAGTSDGSGSRARSPACSAGELGATEDAFWAVRKLLEHLARERPIVLVFDDIHWAEPTFLDLIEYLADWTRESAVLILCIARPELLEVRPGWGGGRLHATSIVLEPLPGEDASLLVDNLLGRADIPRVARDRILEAAEGNPLFVEEMLAMLIDDGLLRFEGGAWRSAEDLANVTVPPTIHLLLAARLDRLDAEERARDRARLGRGQGVPPGRRDDAQSGLGEAERSLASPDAGEEGADPAGSRRVRRRGRLPVPAPPDPRRRVPGDAEGAARRTARAIRRLARGRRRGAHGRVRGDPRSSPGAGVSVPRGAGRDGRAGDGVGRRAAGICTFLRSEPTSARTSSRERLPGTKHRALRRTERLRSTVLLSQVLEEDADYPEGATPRSERSRWPRPSATVGGAPGGARPDHGSRAGGSPAFGRGDIDPGSAAKSSRKRGDSATSSFATGRCCARRSCPSSWGGRADRGDHRRADGPGPAMPRRARQEIAGQSRHLRVLRLAPARRCVRRARPGLRSSRATAPSERARTCGSGRVCRDGRALRGGARSGRPIGGAVRRARQPGSGRRHEAGHRGDAAAGGTATTRRRRSSERCTRPTRRWARPASTRRSAV